MRNGPESIKNHVEHNHNQNETEKNPKENIKDRGSSTMGAAGVTFSLNGEKIERTTGEPKSNQEQNPVAKTEAKTAESAPSSKDAEKIRSMIEDIDSSLADAEAKAKMDEFSADVEKRAREALDQGDKDAAAKILTEGLRDLNNYKAAVLEAVKAGAAYTEAIEIVRKGPQHNAEPIKTGEPERSGPEDAPQGGHDGPTAELPKPHNLAPTEFEVVQNRDGSKTLNFGDGTVVVVPSFVNPSRPPMPQPGPGLQPIAPTPGPGFRPIPGSAPQPGPGLQPIPTAEPITEPFTPITEPIAPVTDIIPPDVQTVDAIIPPRPSHETLERTNNRLRRKSSLGNKIKKTVVGAVAAVLLTLGISGAGSALSPDRPNTDPIGSGISIAQAGTMPSQETDFSEILTAAGETAETIGFQDGYNKANMYGDTEAKAKEGLSAVSFANLQGLIETNNGDIAKSLDQLNQNQIEAAADEIATLDDVDRPAGFQGMDDLRAVEQKLEGLSKDNQQQVLDHLQKLHAESTFTYDTIDGTVSNAWMRTINPDAPLSHDNLELVYSKTNEHGTKVIKMTTESGGTYTIKLCGQRVGAETVYKAIVEVPAEETSAPATVDTPSKSSETSSQDETPSQEETHDKQETSNQDETPSQEETHDKQETPSQEETHDKQETTSNPETHPEKETPSENDTPPADTSPEKTPPTITHPEDTPPQAKSDAKTNLHSSTEESGGSELPVTGQPEYPNGQGTGGLDTAETSGRGGGTAAGFDDAGVPATNVEKSSAASESQSPTEETYTSTTPSAEEVSSATKTSQADEINPPDRSSEANSNSAGADFATDIPEALRGR